MYNFTLEFNNRISHCYNSSTIDIKTDIGNLEDVFDSSNIYNLIPRHFRYKEDTSEQHIGLISEEVDEIETQY